MNLSGLENWFIVSNVIPWVARRTDVFSFKVEENPRERPNRELLYDFTEYVKWTGRFPKRNCSRKSLVLNRHCLEEFLEM